MAASGSCRSIKMLKLIQITRAFRPCRMSGCPYRFIFIYRTHDRGFSTDHQPPHKPEITPPGKLKSYIVKKYIGYVEGFELKVEKHYPRVYKVYKLFKEGISEFFADTKLYYSVATDIWAGRSLHTLSRKELETYKQHPKDMLHVAPTIALYYLPITDVITPFLMYMFPRHLLCRHFWTPEQRMEFAVHDLRQRLPFYPRILHSLERHAKDVRDVEKRALFTHVIQKVQQDKQPTVEELLNLKSLFVTRPFGMRKMPKLQHWYVARGWDFSTILMKPFVDSTVLLHGIDLAIHREGVSSLTLGDLQQACFTRGLNAEGLSEDELRKALTLWISLSSEIDDSCLALLLHAPVFLWSNYPSNKRYLLSEVDVRQPSDKPSASGS